MTQPGEDTSNPKTGKSETVKASGVEMQIDLGFKSSLTPYMLLMLRDWSLHGYQIWQRLMEMKLPGLNEHDRPAVYRLLRQLEEEGKLSSQWDTADKSGPARRVYTLTDTGKDFLGLWAAGLDQYRRTLDFFFKVYTGGMVASPFDLKSWDKSGKVEESEEK